MSETSSQSPGAEGYRRTARDEEVGITPTTDEYQSRQNSQRLSQVAELKAEVAKIQAQDQSPKPAKRNPDQPWPTVGALRRQTQAGDQVIPEDSSIS